MTITTENSYKSVVFIPQVDDINVAGYYYKATLSENDESSHHILLYTIGVSSYKEPKNRWIMLDVTEHHASEDRGVQAETVVNALEAYDSMHYILSYVGDVYNAETKFHDSTRNGDFIP